jgi:hypothetical protein
MDTITVVCDRCGRPGWRLETGAISGEVVIGGNRIDGADGSAYWDRVLRGPRAHRYPPRKRAPYAGGGRPGAFILPADDRAAGQFEERWKLVCIGRRHPRYERVVTRESAERAYRAAVAAGHASIRLSEI